MSALREVLHQPMHMAVRFFTSLSPRPASVRAERFADDHLSPSERELWIQLSNQDRRHSAGVARRFVEVRPDATPHEISGALLHDVGKIECRLGTLQRVVATLVGPRTKRYAAYHDHEAIGARMAAAVGSHPDTVELIAGRGPAFDQLEFCDH